MLGQELPEYSTDEETVLILLERVNEAQRMASRELRELQESGKLGGRHGKRKGGGDLEEGDEGQNALDKMLKKRGKKKNRR